MIHYNPVQLISGGGLTGSLVWQDPVIDADVASLPGSPSTGDRYVLSAAHGTNPDEIAEWSGTAWDYTVPLDGYTLWSIADDEMITWNGTTWVVISGSGTGNHNSLFGLQGGTTAEYYHLTATQHGYIDQDVTTTASPQFSGLTVAADTDTEIILGRAKLNGPFADYATFAHYDFNTTTAYALATNGSDSLVNASSNVYLSIGGQFRFQTTNTGVRIKTAGDATLQIDALNGTYDSNIDFQQNNTTGGWIRFDHALAKMDFQCSGGAWFSHDVNVADDLYVTDNVVAGALLCAETYLRLKEVATPGAAAPGYGYLYTKTDEKLYFFDASGVEHDLLAGGATGDVVGPTGSVDNGIVRFDGVTGKLIQDSAGTLDDTGVISLTGVACGMKLGPTYSMLLSGAECQFKGPYEIWTFDGSRLSINEQRRDFDFQIGGDGIFYAMFLRGSDGSVGFGTNSLGGLMTVRRDNPTNETTLYLQNYNNNQQTTNTMLKMQHGNTINTHQPYMINILNGSTQSIFVVKGDGRTGVGLDPTANMTGLAIESGLLTLKETTTPTADTNYGKIYTKSDNSLYFQDGAGTEHTVAIGSVGKVIQRVTTVYTSAATGTTIMPVDNTIPQNTEGTEFMTRAITPTDSTNIIEIEVEFWWSTNIVNGMAAAIFQDSTANALSAGSDSPEQSYTMAHIFHLKHRMVAGTTSSTTFKFRSGQNAAHTMTMNGVSGGGWFNGTMQSRMTITEYET